MNLNDSPFSHLRPSTIPESLDRGLAVLFRFAPFLFLASFVAGSDYLLSLILNHVQGVDLEHPGLAAAMLLLMLLGDFASALSLLIMFQGLLFPLRPLSAKALLRTALRKLPVYFFTQFLYLTAVVFCLLIAYGSFTARVGISHEMLRSGVGILAMMLACWIAIRLSLAPVVSLIEETWPIAAFIRSMQLTASLPSVDGQRRDSPVVRWFALVLLPASITVLLFAVTLYVAYLSPRVTLPLRWDNPAVIDLKNIFAFLAAFLALPFFRAGLMTLYIEYRMRHEALDFYLRLRERRRDSEKPAASTPE